MARNLMPFRSGAGLLGPNDPFLSLHREMNRLFDDVLRGSMGSVSDGQSGVGSIISADMNVSETDKEICITAELPGVTDQDIDISLDDDLLTIRGEKKFERNDEKENFHFVERSYGTFQRSVRLPFNAKPEAIAAQFQNGVLKITVPKSAEQNRSRKIQIQGAAQGSQGQGGSGEARSGQAEAATGSKAAAS